MKRKLLILFICLLPLVAEGQYTPPYDTDYTDWTVYEDSTFTDSWSGVGLDSVLFLNCKWENVSPAGNTLVYLQNSNYIHFKNDSILSNRKYGGADFHWLFCDDDVSNVWVDNCYGIDQSADFIQIGTGHDTTGGSGDYMYNIWITNNTFGVSKDTSSENAIDVKGCDNIYIANNTFFGYRGCVDDGAHGCSGDIGIGIIFHKWSTKNAIVERNNIYDCSNGVLVTAGSGARIGSPENITLRNNFIHDCITNFSTYGGTTELKLYNNTFGDWESGASVYLDDVTGSDTLFAANIMGYTGSYNDATDFVRTITTDMEGYNYEWIELTAEYFNDPINVDTSLRDYRITSAATTAIDQSIDLSSYFEDYIDIDSTIRPQGSAPDIGAFEYITATPPTSGTWSVDSTLINFTTTIPLDEQGWYSVPSESSATVNLDHGWSITPQDATHEGGDQGCVGFPYDTAAFTYHFTNGLNDTLKILFEGLTPNDTISILVDANRDATATNRTSRFDANGVIDTIDAQECGDSVLLSGIIVDGSGEVLLQMVSPTQYSYLNYAIIYDSTYLADVCDTTTIITTAITTPAPNGTITTTTTGGVEPYTYDWSNDSTTKDLTELDAGIYSVIVTDANTCTGNGSWDVDESTSQSSIGLGTFNGGLWTFQGGLVSYTPTPLWLNNLSLHNIDTIPLIAGYIYELQNDEISLIPIGENSTLDYEYTSNIGYYEPMADSLINNTTFQRSGKYIIDSSYNIGYFPINIKATKNSKIYDEIDKVFHIIPDQNMTGDRTIMFVGNSITSQGENTQIDSVRKSLTGINPIMVGSYGTPPNNHTGNSGKTYAWFLSSSSPFYNGSQIDINDYREDTLGLSSPFDYVVINLGVNDIFGAIDTAFISTTLINRVKTLIGEFKEDTTQHIIIACPTLNENSGLGWEADYPTTNQDEWNNKMIHFREKIIENFDNFAYDTAVYVSMHANYLDRDNGYPVDGSGNHNNGVHPNTTGQYDIAHAVTSTIERILFNEGENEIDNPNFETWAGNAQPNDFPTSWILLGNTASAYIEELPDNNAHYVSNSTSLLLRQLVGSTGDEWDVTVVVSDWVSGSIRLRNSSIDHSIFFGKGIHKFSFTATTNNIMDFRSFSTDLDMTISHIIMKKIN